MRVTQVDKNVFKLDNIEIDFKEVKFSKALLQKVEEMRARQAISVLNAESAVEYAKNKQTTLDVVYLRLLSLPNDIKEEVLPEEVEVLNNIGSLEEPEYIRFNLPRQVAVKLIKINPRLTLADKQLEQLAYG